MGHIRSYATYFEFGSRNHCGRASECGHHERDRRARHETIVSRPDPAQLEKFGIRGSSIWSHPDGNELAGIMKLIEAGKIKPVVGQVMPLTEAVIASQQAETHHTRGKIVLKIAEEPK